MPSVSREEGQHDQDGDEIGYAQPPWQYTRWRSHTADYSWTSQANCVWSWCPVVLKTTQGHTRQVLRNSYPCKFFHIMSFLADSDTYLPRMSSQPSSIASASTITISSLSTYYMNLNLAYGRPFLHISCGSYKRLEELWCKTWTSDIDKSPPLGMG